METRVQRVRKGMVAILTDQNQKEIAMKVVHINQEIQASIILGNREKYAENCKRN